MQVQRYLNSSKRLPQKMIPTMEYFVLNPDYKLKCLYTISKCVMRADFNLPLSTAGV